MTSPTTVLRVGHPRDLLAYVPFRLGYRPRESLVVLCLRGPRRRVGAVLRIDLPRAGGRVRPAARAPGALVEVVAGHARRDGAAALVLVAYAEPAGPLAPGAALPSSALVRSLAAELRRRGLEVPEAWHVGDGRYRSYLCAGRACCPPEGFPLTDLDASIVAPELVARGLRVGDAESSLVAGLEPAPEPARRAVAAARAASWQARGGAGSPRRRAWRREVLATWLAALAAVSDALAAAAGDERPPSPRQLAERSVDEKVAGLLLAGLTDLFTRDAVLLTAVPGCADAAAAMLDGDPASGLPEAVSAVFDRVFGPRGPAVGAAVGAGRGPAAGPGTGRLPPAMPDPGLREAVDALLSVLVRRAEPGCRAPALALLAFTAWFAGDGGRARLLVERALADEPEHGLAALVGETLARGLPPAWVAIQREDDLAAADTGGGIPRPGDDGAGSTGG